MNVVRWDKFKTELLNVGGHVPADITASLERATQILRVSANANKRGRADVQYDCRMQAGPTTVPTHQTGFR